MKQYELFHVLNQQMTNVQMVHNLQKCLVAKIFLEWIKILIEILCRPRNVWLQKEVAGPCGEYLWRILVLLFCPPDNANIIGKAFGC